MNGVDGYKVTSKKLGYKDCFIFLPAAGWRGTGPIYQGSYGLYWSSSLNTSLPWDALSLNFDSDNRYRGSDARSYGRSVRPVCP